MAQLEGIQDKGAALQQHHDSQVAVRSAAGGGAPEQLQDIYVKHCHLGPQQQSLQGNFNLHFRFGRRLSISTRQGSRTAAQHKQVEEA